MEAHPLFSEVSHVIDKYPEQAASIWQAYLDLKLSQRWEDVEIKDLEAGEICVLLGRNPKQTVWHLICRLMAKAMTDSVQQSQDKSVIYPMSLDNSTSMALLQLPFIHLQPCPESALLAITSEDSSIVYYKIAKGIVAPKEVKD